jgi:hypothetical protein
VKLGLTILAYYPNGGGRGRFVLRTCQRVKMIPATPSSASSVIGGNSSPLPEVLPLREHGWCCPCGGALDTAKPSRLAQDGR